MPLDNPDLKLDIVDGKVSLHPFSFGVGTGRINGDIGLTPQGIRHMPGQALRFSELTSRD